MGKESAITASDIIEMTCGKEIYENYGFELVIIISDNNDNSR